MLFGASTLSEHELYVLLLCFSLDASRTLPYTTKWWHRNFHLSHVTGVQRLEGARREQAGTSEYLFENFVLNYSENFCCRGGGGWQQIIVLIFTVKQFEHEKICKGKKASRDIKMFENIFEARPRVKQKISALSGIGFGRIRLHPKNQFACQRTVFAEIMAL